MEADLRAWGGRGRGRGIGNWGHVGTSGTFLNPGVEDGLSPGDGGLGERGDRAVYLKEGVFLEKPLAT